MASMKIFDIAGSGMTAQSLRLNLVASNMANVDAVSSSIEKTYKARVPVFRAVMDEFNKQTPATGVNMVGVLESEAPLTREYAPNHPAADQDGYIFRPNVNVVEEMANMISASRSYQSNVEVANTSKQLLLETLRLGQ